MTDRKNNDKAKSNPLERYIKMLEAVASAPDGMTGPDLARVLDLPKSTVVRLLATLEASDLLRSAARKGHFTLGGRLLRMLQSDTGWLEVGGKRTLQALVRDTGETCFVARLNGALVQSVMHESPDASVGIYVVPGHVLPPHVTATGKLLSAYQPPDMQAAILGDGVLTRASGEVVTRAALQQEFEQIRARGHAIEDGEHVPGLYTLAVPIIISPDLTPVYALGLTGLAARIRERAMGEFLGKLQGSAADLGRAFGPYLHR